MTVNIPIKRQCEYTMTCNYRNSAGTDLDSLFYIDNSNRGALGFQVSNGQDLGNRFTAMSTLGYNVEYKNNAGTDLGYLRGNLVPPNPSSSTSGLTLTRHQRFENGYRYTDLEESTDDEGHHTGWHPVTRYATMLGLYYNLTINANAPMSTVTVAYRITYSYVRFDGTNLYKFFDNHNLTTYNEGEADGQFWDGYAGVFKTVTYNNVNSSSWSHNFGLVCVPFGWYHCNFTLRCDCTISNAAGSTNINSNTHGAIFDQM